MLGRDVALAHLHGFAQRVLEHALDTRRERQVTRNVGVLVDDDNLADGLDDVIVRNFETSKRLRRQALLLADQTEQQMLGADIGLMQVARLVLREHEHLARLVGELLKRHTYPISRVFAREKC